MFSVEKRFSGKRFPFLIFHSNQRISFHQSILVTFSVTKKTILRAKVFSALRDLQVFMKTVFQHV